MVSLVDENIWKSFLTEELDIDFKRSKAAYNHVMFVLSILHNVIFIEIFLVTEYNDFEAWIESVDLILPVSRDV